MSIKEVAFLEDWLLLSQSQSKIKSFQKAQSSHWLEKSLFVFGHINRLIVP